MRVLITSMAAMAETGGPITRTVTLAKSLQKEGFEVATCLAQDVNFRKIDDIPNYFLDIPMPLGLPKFIASRMFPIVQKLGITSKKTVLSFDEVLLFTGNLNYPYLRKSVESLRRAIVDFNPDIVYSEFNISGFIAAKLEHKKIFATVSYPTNHNFACNPKLAKDLNKLLKEYGIKPVDSALQLFDWADKKFCPSISQLEPLENVTFCGAWQPVNQVDCPRNKILVYMGNGTISARKMERQIRKAFFDSKYEVYIASGYLKPCSDGNIHIAKRWDFNQLLNETVVFINHGGQNSIVSGLLHGTPQLIVPGKVFERKYNAKSVADNKAGIVLDYRHFTGTNIRRSVEQIATSVEMRTNAVELGKRLLEQGGIQRVVDEMNKI